MHLKQAIIDSLMVCHDPDSSRRCVDGHQVGYLRFVPIETPMFRHGLSISVIVKRGEEDAMKDAVAEYLLEAIESLTGASDPVTWG